MDNLLDVQAQIPVVNYPCATVFTISKGVKENRIEHFCRLFGVFNRTHRIHFDSTYQECGWKFFSNGAKQVFSMNLHGVWIQRFASFNEFVKACWHHYLD